MANKRVKVDGRIISVPDDATPEEIDAIAGPYRPDFAANPPGMPAVRKLDMEMSALGKIHRIATDPGVIVPAIVNGMEQTQQDLAVNPSVLHNEGVGSRLAKYAADSSIGAMKGALHTGISLSPAINKIPYVGETLAPQSGIDEAKRVSTPTSTPQKLGYTGEQVAEWMLPTGAEGKAAGLTAQLLKQSPNAARLAVPAARIATSAVESGVRNKIQGGDFTTGAAAGGFGTAAAPVLKKAASGLAEIAVAPGKRLLKSIPEGVDIGKTVLENTTGVKPATITRQLGEKVASQSAALDGVISQADQAGLTVPIDAARNIARDEISTAVKKNAPGYIRDVGKVNDQLLNQYGSTGEVIGPVPAAVSPSKARAIKQGIDLNIGTWNPESQANIGPLQERVRGSIASGIHAAVPGSEALDKSLTSLIPAKDAAWNTSFNPGVARSVVARIARPTGALAGAIAGGYEGHKVGGTEGMITGGIIGLAAPELIASPEGQMLMARGLTSPMVGRLAKGGLLQIARPSALDKK